MMKCIFKIIGIRWLASIINKVNILTFTILGIDGVLQAYSNCIRRVQLYGPTNVAPIINHVARFAASAQQEESSKGAHVSFDYLYPVKLFRPFIVVVSL